MKPAEEPRLPNGHGYCWAEPPGGRARCTRPAGHDGDHMDYYTGRKKPTDAVGTTWPQ